MVNTSVMFIITALGSGTKTTLEEGLRSPNGWQKESAVFYNNRVSSTVIKPPHVFFKSEGI